MLWILYINGAYTFLLANSLWGQCKRMGKSETDTWGNLCIKEDTTGSFYGQTLILENTWRYAYNLAFKLRPIYSGWRS